MGKLVVADAKLLRQRFKASREAVNEVKSRARAHAKMIDFEEKAERMAKALGGTVNGILSAFERLNKTVVRRMERTGLTATQIITADVKKDILEPYKKFLTKEFKSDGIESAIEFQNEKRAKDIKMYGKTDTLIASINKYHDAVINKYLLPLKTIEAQFNSLDYLKGKGAYNAITGKVQMLLGTAEDAKVVESEQTESIQEIG